MLVWRQDIELPEPGQRKEQALLLHRLLRRGMTCMNVNRPEDFDVIVLGAGAAGLMRHDRRRARPSSAVTDHADEVGKKIPISGGGGATSQTFTRRQVTSFQATRIFANRRWRATPIRFHCPDRQAPNSLARKNPGSAVLRRVC